jgi:UDPglucose 6-dehydrogenase
MKIIVLGSGYVGLVTGTCFADRGNKVYCIDVDPKKVESINKGISPIYEPGLDELLVKNIKNGNLKAYLAEDFYNQKIPADISFICVPTPSAEDGSMSFKYVETASKDLGKYIKDLDQYHVVVTKSTVVPGTTDSVVLPLLEKYSEKKVGKDFGLCMNPEFLREGTAIEDFFKTDKIVIGEIDKKSGDLLEKVYSSCSNSRRRIIPTTINLFQ